MSLSGYNEKILFWLSVINSLIPLKNLVNGSKVILAEILTKHSVNRPTA